MATGLMILVHSTSCRIKVSAQIDGGDLAFFFFFLPVNHDWDAWTGKPPAVTRPVASRWVPDPSQLFPPPENMLSPLLFVSSSDPISPSTIIILLLPLHTH